MTRIMSYNILAGGYDSRNPDARRTDALLRMIHAAQLDVVGLVEAINPQVQREPSVVEELAQALDMQLVRGIELGSQEYQLALLTRLPIISAKVHTRPGLLSRPLLEVRVEEENGEHLTVCVMHLSASFDKGRAGGHIRKREVEEILHILAPLRAAKEPHVLMGDCNSLAPGEALKASALLRYVVQLEAKYHGQNMADGNPYLNNIVPERFGFLKPVLRLIARSDLLCSLFDAAAYFYAPRGCIRQLQRVYADSFRLLHPHDLGFTCPASAPAGRIDYIFASSNVAERLTTCSVIQFGEDDLPAFRASDHLPLAADFALRVDSQRKVSEEEGTLTFADS